MVGRIRYSNDYGINESCRFGGSAEREKREKKKVGMQKSLFAAAIDAFLYAFACISTSAPLFLFSS